MATDIVQGLFGMTPESYQQQRDAAALQRAASFGQMDPMQAARTSIYYGANKLGDVVGGMLGAEDPQMRLISQRNALAKQIDMNDPESIMRGAQMAAQAGDTVAASTLADYARKAASDLALIQQRTRERQAADPLQQLIRSGKYTPSSIATYAKSGNVADLESIEKLAKEPSPLDIQKAQIYRQSLIDAKAPASQIAEVDAYIKGLTTGKGTVVQNIMPGDKNFADIPAFRSSVQKTVEPMSKVVFAADNALTNIDDSIKTNNFASFRAAQVQFARAIAGSGDLSQKELLAAGADPAILGGTADYISRLFSSTPTIDTQNKIKSTLSAIRTVSVNKANEEIDRQRKIALRNKNYNPQDVETALDFPEFKKPMGGTGPFTDAEKEQRYQEYKRKQSGAKQ